MAQYLKLELQERMVDAALTLFSSRGFRTTKMKDVAAYAGVSTGNLYRYFENKRVLFEEAVPVSMRERFLLLLRERVDAHGEWVLSAISRESYLLAVEALLRFSIEHRREVVLMLRSEVGGPCEGFSEVVQGELIERVCEQVEAFGWRKVESRSMRFALAQIYENFFRSLVRLLTTFEEEAAIRAAAEDLSRYHLAGLRGFFSMEEGSDGH